MSVTAHAMRFILRIQLELGKVLGSSLKPQEYSVLSTPG